MTELKTLKDLEKQDWSTCKEDNGLVRAVFFESRQEAIKLFKNLQWKDSIYPLILNKFPDNQKGSIAKKRWNDTDFRYGAEYGMLALLHYFFNITEGDINGIK